MRKSGIWRESQKMWNDIRKNNNNGLIQKPELHNHINYKSFYLNKEQNIDSEIRKHSELFK
jgi:hypothetical protein